MLSVFMSRATGIDSIALDSECCKFCEYFNLEYLSAFTIAFIDHPFFSS